jgi:hypothetical protein
MNNGDYMDNVPSCRTGICLVRSSTQHSKCWANTYRPVGLVGKMNHAIRPVKIIQSIRHCKINLAVRSTHLHQINK